MIVPVDIRFGNNRSEYLTKKNIQVNIDALDRAIDGKSRCGDFVLLVDTKSILEGIQKQLPSF